MPRDAIVLITPLWTTGGVLALAWCIRQGLPVMLGICRLS